MSTLLAPVQHLLVMPALSVLVYGFDHYSQLYLCQAQHYLRGPLLVQQ